MLDYISIEQHLLHPICEERSIGAMLPYGEYVGAGGLPRNVRVEFFGGDSADVPVSEYLNTVLAFLSPTRAQLAEALGVSRQRIYQILGGERPGIETLERLQRLTQLAAQWQRRHDRPMGMILPKPSDETSALWSELAEKNPSRTQVDGLLKELDAKHIAFETKEARNAAFRSATPEPGLVGLLPPQGYWATG